MTRSDRQIARFLQDEGVDISGLVERPGHRSQFAFIASEPGGRRTIFWQRPTGEALKPAEIRWSILRASRVLHTDGLFIEASLAAASEARRSGVIVVVDAGTLRDGMLELARLSDCFVSSESFARSLVGGDDPLEACRRIVELGPGIAGVTLGARGYVARFDGRSIVKPAYAVEAVDTTGCGDVFHAGLAYGILPAGTPREASILPRGPRRRWRPGWAAVRGSRQKRICWAGDTSRGLRRESPALKTSRVRARIDAPGDIL